MAVFGSLPRRDHFRAIALLKRTARANRLTADDELIRAANLISAQVLLDSEREADNKAVSNQLAEMTDPDSPHYDPTIALRNQEGQVIYGKDEYGDVISGSKTFINGQPLVIVKRRKKQGRNRRRRR